MTAEITEYTPPTLEPRRAAFLPTQPEYRFMQTVAEHLAATEFVPRGVRGKPPAVLACMLTGREMGIGPMRALRQIDVIDGRPAPSPELLMARVLEAGHYIRVTETTRDRCVVRTRRKEWADDEPTFELEWTMEDAEEAGLAGKKNWTTYRRAMLRSRCVGETVRAVHPDIAEGASYSPEELTQGDVFDPAARQVALDGLPDDLRAQVEDAMGDVDQVVDRIGRLHAEGVLSDEQAAKAREHVGWGPKHVAEAVERLDQLERAVAETDDDVVDAEVVDAEDDSGLTVEHYQRLAELGFTEDPELEALALWATGARTAATTAVTADERELLLAAAALTGEGTHSFAVGSAKLTTTVDGNVTEWSPEDVRVLLDEAGDE